MKFNIDDKVKVFAERTSISFNYNDCVGIIQDVMFRERDCTFIYGVEIERDIVWFFEDELKREGE